MGGMPTHPQWYKNLLVNPELTVEYRGKTFQARATTVPNSPERDVLFARMNEVITGLYGYQDRAASHRQNPDREPRGTRHGPRRTPFLTPAREPEAWGDEGPRD